MINKSKSICVIMIAAILFGILSVGCSADIAKPHIKNDPAAVQSENESENVNAGSEENEKEDGDNENTEKTHASFTVDKSSLDTFESEKELLEYINDNQLFYLYETEVAEVANEAGMDTAEMPTATATNAAGNGMKTSENRDVSTTNLVDENVDEGDYLKTDGDYIYIIRDNELIIVSANGKETEVLSYYKLFAQGEGNVSEMYIKGDRAIVIANVTFYEKPDFISDTSFGKPVDEINENDVIDEYYYDRYYNSYKTYSAVYVIDISDREKPKEESSCFVEGYLVATRETSGRIYLIANKDIGGYYWGYYRNEPAAADILPEVYDTKNGYRTVEATNVIRPIFENVYPNMMTIAVIDYLNTADTETLSVLGSGSDIYMTAESLYIFSGNGNNTCVAKYSIGNTLSYVASAVVPGYTATDFSYNEYNGKFRIATTTWGNSTENNVYVYDEKLVKTGELTGLAPNERIYSVRFSGDVAYVVTFRQVDPLFVIDMSGNDPKVTGELKVPGFSTYLHPVGDGLLLGIGKETKDNVWTDYNGEKYVQTYTDGIKVSLFDVSDPFDPKEKDVENYIGGESASTEAWYNHRAFVYSNAKNTGYFPIHTMNGEAVVCISVENGELTCKTVPASENFSYYSGNSRICYVDDMLYFYRYNRISVYSRDTLEEIASITVK